MKISLTALTAMLAVLPASLAAPAEAPEPGLQVLEPRCVKIGNACKYGDHGCCGDLTCKADIHITGEPGTCGHP